MIQVNNICKDYGNGCGVFDLNFRVNQGEILGFLGPNGAGKTTTIRLLMGFLKPTQGSLSICGMDCFRQQDQIQKEVGYLPGEIHCMDEMSGIQFIRFIADMKRMKNFDKMEYLIEYFALDKNQIIRKMSKGMKQKVAIICAFMHDPKILILDEPTSGLDPLMQNKFVSLLLKEKQNGKTILMSSHMFEEVEKTCDRVVIIKEGRSMALTSIEEVVNSQKKTYEISFYEASEAHSFCTLMDGEQVSNTHVQVQVQNVDALIAQLRDYRIKDITRIQQSLEQLFLEYYGGEND